MSVPEPGPANAPAPRRSRSRLFVLVTGALALLAGLFTVLLTTISRWWGRRHRRRPYGSATGQTRGGHLPRELEL